MSARPEARIRRAVQPLPALALCLAPARLGFLAGLDQPKTGVSTLPDEGYAMTNGMNRWMTLERAVLGAIFGGVFAVILLGFGVLRLIIYFVMGIPVDYGRYGAIQMVIVSIGYCGGFAVAGAVVYALWPLRKSTLGSYLVGYIGAGIVSGILGLMIMWLEHDYRLLVNLLTVCLMTLIFGTAAGYQIQHWDRR